jgi:hypothetical protein
MSEVSESKDIFTKRRLQEAKVNFISKSNLLNISDMLERSIEKYKQYVMIDENPTTDYLNI